MKKLNALVIGATGATGREIVQLLVNDNEVEKVTIFVRNDPFIEHKKLTTYAIDFNGVQNHKDLIKGDVLFSALGTTKKVASGKKEQYLVDYTFQYEFAQIAAENGVENYSLVSAVGANSKSSFFYPKIKGELEEAIKKLKFKKIAIFQPPMLVRQPDLVREGEKSGIKLLNFLNKIGILNSHKPLEVNKLAEKMVKIAKTPPKEKVSTYLPKDLLN